MRYASVAQSALNTGPVLSTVMANARARDARNSHGRPQSSKGSRDHMTTRKVQTFVSLENFRVIQDEAIRRRRSIRAVCSDALSAYAARVEIRQGEYENGSRIPRMTLKTYAPTTREQEDNHV